MNRQLKRLLSFFLILMLLFGQAGAVMGLGSAELELAVNDTAEYMLKAVRSPQVGSIGGEWAVIGLARSGYDVPERYYQDYYATVEEYVKACDGNLHDKKYTEYSRLIVALSSIGKDARNVAGYDLTKALGDYDKTIWQGLNGPIWALIALDSRDYPMPVNPEAKTQATRQMYIDRILECQLADGGWSLFGGTAAAASGDGKSDPDITGMALQALAKYQDQPKVAKATEEALGCMSKAQSAAGGYSSWGTVNSESCVQIIVALTELGVSLDDPRFVKNENTLLDNLMTFYLPGKGFLHTADGSGSNQMASEQGFYGLVAAYRAQKGANSLYRMDDAIQIGDRADGASGSGLEGKHEDVQVKPVTHQGKTFMDISGANAHDNQAAIEALAAREIVAGVSDTSFAPDKTLTRAEFAAILIKALGLSKTKEIPFQDVNLDSWYGSAVACAYNYGLISGKAENIFDPNGEVSRQEAATMVTRAASLCGLDTGMDNGQIRDMLAQFVDYQDCDSWARASLAYCYQEYILNQNDLVIRPSEAVSRGEMAQIIYNLLSNAELL